MSRQFGPFRLVRRLGVGGMAETFEAARQGPGGFEHRVCLKRVLPAFSENADFVRQFQREANLAAQLRHSNIVGVLDFGAHEETHYMALELVDGIDLRAFLTSRPAKRLSAEMVALIGMDLAYALHHAHSLGYRRPDRGEQEFEGVVHRDVSPDNVLISRAGEVKLADFGIAKAINNAAATASGTIKGKIPYMAPEHILGKPVDGRADLFSLGVVLFEAVSGVRPFDGTHDVETMRRILDNQRVTLAEVAPDVPKSLATIIEDLLVIDPDKRTKTADELIRKLAATAAPSPQVRREIAASIEEQRGGWQSREHVRKPDAEPDTDVDVEPDTQITAITGDDARVQSQVPAAAPAGTANPPQITYTDGAFKKRTIRWPWIAVPILLLAIGAGIRFWPSEASISEADTEETADASETDRKANAETAERVVATDTADADTSPVSSKDADPAAASNTQDRVGDDTAVDPPDTENSAAVRTAREPDTDKDVATKPRTRKKVVRKKGSLRIFVIPRGEVWIDRRYMGEVSRKLYPVSPGKHLVQAGYDRPQKSRTVTVRPGKTVRVEFDLDP